MSSIIQELNLMLVDSDDGKMIESQSLKTVEEWITTDVNVIKRHDRSLNSKATDQIAVIPDNNKIIHVRWDHICTIKEPRAISKSKEQNHLDREMLDPTYCVRIVTSLRFQDVKVAWQDWIHVNESIIVFICRPRCRSSLFCLPRSYCHWLNDSTISSDWFTTVKQRYSTWFSSFRCSLSAWENWARGRSLRCCWRRTEIQYDKIMNHESCIEGKKK